MVVLLLVAQLTHKPGCFAHYQACVLEETKKCRTIECKQEAAEDCADRVRKLRENNGCYPDTNTIN